MSPCVMLIEQLYFSSPEPLAYFERLRSFDVCCVLHVVPGASSSITSKAIFSLSTGWIFTKLGLNAFFNNCSDGSSLLHI